MNTKYVAALNTLMLFFVLSFTSMTGCVTRERAVSYETSEIGNDTIENKSVQVYSGPHMKKTVDKQIVSEKIKCVGKNGKLLPATTVEGCLKLKGKLVDEVTVEEEITTRK